MQKKYSIEIVTRLAILYKSKKDFKKNCYGAFQWACRNKIINDECIFGHMKSVRSESNTRYYYEDIVLSAKKYKTRKQFQNSEDRGAYNWCYKNKLLNDSNIFGHMIKPKSNRAKWNFQNTSIEAKKYGSRKEFEINSAGAYKWARTNKCLDEVCSHMKKSFIDWDLDLIIKISKKYSSKGKFITENSGAYGWIVRNNHKNNSKIFNHMQTAKSGFDINKPAILYYLKICDGAGYKIGITNRTVSERFNNKDLDKIEVLSIIDFANGKDAKKEETRILKEYKNAKYTGRKLLKDGNSELFRFDILNLDKER